jgi:hypothetical protein
LNYNDLIEEEDTIDFDEIAKMANPALFSNQTNDTQYVGSNYQDFFGDDLNLNSLPTEEVKEEELPTENIDRPDTQNYDKNLDTPKELISTPALGEGLKIISLPSDEDQDDTEILSDLSKAFTQANKEDTDPDYPVGDDYASEEEQILDLDKPYAPEEKESQDLSREEVMGSDLNLQKIEDDLEESISDIAGGESEQPMVIKKENNDLEDINLVGVKVDNPQEEYTQNESLLDLVQELPLDTQTEDTKKDITENNEDLLSSKEPKVSDLTLPKSMLTLAKNAKEQSLEGVLGDITTVSELSSEENYDLGTTSNVESNEPATVNPTADIKNDNHPGSALDQTLAKMNTGSNLNTLLDESLKEAKDYDLEKLDFHFANIKKEEPEVSKQDKVSNSDQNIAKGSEPAPPPALPANAKPQVYSSMNPTNTTNKSGQRNNFSVANQNDFPGLASGRHFDFTGGVEDIVIHDEKIRLKKSLGNILAVVIIILFVCALGYIAFKIYNEVKVII